MYRFNQIPSRIDARMAEVAKLRDILGGMPRENKMALMKNLAARVLSTEQ